MPARIERVHVQGRRPRSRRCLSAGAPGRRPPMCRSPTSRARCWSRSGMAFEELESPAGNVRPDDAADASPRGLAPGAGARRDRPSAVVLVGGDADSLDGAVRELTAAGVPYRAIEDPAEITSPSYVELGPTPSYWCFPGGRSPEASVDLVMRALPLMQERGWRPDCGCPPSASTRGQPGHAPLWGLARVAAAEHPQFGAASSTCADGRCRSARSPRYTVTVLSWCGRVSHSLRALLDRTRSGAVPDGVLPGGTYLITGGTGVLGLRMAQRLADLGARRLVLLSRSGIPDRSAWTGEPRSEAEAAISALEDAWCHTVTAAAVDIGAPGAADALRAVLADLPASAWCHPRGWCGSRCAACRTKTEDFAAAMHPRYRTHWRCQKVFPPRSNSTGWCCSRRAATSPASRARVPTRARTRSST